MEYLQLWHFVKQQLIIKVRELLYGSKGAEKIKTMMEKMRKNPPKKLGEYDVLEVRDYEEHTIVKADGTKGETDLPTSNVLYYDLNDNSWCCARPSGTEPKIKFYMGVKGTSLEQSKELVEKLQATMLGLVE